MLEQRRQEYLSTLGIDTFVPRRRIEGAQPSRALFAVELPDERQTPENPAFKPQNILQEEINQGALAQETVLREQETAPQDSTPQKSAPQETEAQALIPEQGIPQESQAAPEVAPLPEAVESSKNTETSKSPSKPALALGFVLNIWSINDLVVVNTHEPGSALPVDKLLQNMLFAMGYPLAQLPPADMARWPLFKNDPNNSLDEARAMVQANIGARCSHYQAKGKGKVKVLLMGATAAQMVLAEESGESAHKHGYSEQCEDWQASLLYLPSLVQLLQNPGSKKVAWQAWQTFLANV